MMFRERNSILLCEPYKNHKYTVWAEFKVYVKEHGTYSNLLVLKG
jgi:hypothetical protein